MLKGNELDELIKREAYYGLEVCLRFDGAKPNFGDLFVICGFEHSGCSSSGNFQFASLASLGFSQVDDYFGVTSYEDEGEDVVIWLYPLIKDDSVYHHPGPFDGILLSFSVLRNPAVKSEFFLKVIEEFSFHLPVSVFYKTRELDLGNPADLSIVKSDIQEIIQYWRSEGIEPGSSAALQVHF